MSKEVVHVSEKLDEDGMEFDEPYEEVHDDFNNIINEYDENVINTLMPFMVNILDCMNVGYQQKLEYEAKIQKIIQENIKFYNRQKNAKRCLEQQLSELRTKYEWEREARIFAESRLAEYEKNIENERNIVKQRLGCLEINVQTLEKKFKISTECIEKLEDRETYLKKEYSGLLERYTKLFKEHIDYMERSYTPRHRELLSEEVLNESGLRDDENYNNNEIGDNEDIDERRKDVKLVEGTEIEETVEDKNVDIYEEISLTPSIKHISRLPIKLYK